MVMGVIFHNLMEILALIIFQMDIQIDHLEVLVALAVALIMEALVVVLAMVLVEDLADLVALVKALVDLEGEALDKWEGLVITAINQMAISMDNQTDFNKMEIIEIMRVSLAKKEKPIMKTLNLKRRMKNHKNKSLLV